MSNCNVLVIEDDESVRKLVVDFLRRRPGVHIDSARDGVEGLHRVATSSYDVIVLDIVMPKMSGIDFLDSLEAMMQDPSIPSLQHHPIVLVVTSTEPADLPTLEQRYSGLVRCVFRKPIDLLEFKRCVDRCLDGV